MSFLARLFGRRSPAPRSQVQHSVLDSGGSQFSASRMRNSQDPQQSAMATRRELLRVVLRDTLKRHGVPATWITGETLTAMSRTREPGIYWRLSIKQWDARLPNHCVALQNSLVTRVHMFDPLAEKWLLGITWQFALDDESACPALPHPSSWTAVVPRDDLLDPVKPVLADGDVIAGPVKIESPPADVKADLERLMSALDAQYQHAEAYDQTRPMYAATEPAKL